MEMMRLRSRNTLLRGEKFLSPKEGGGAATDQVHWDDKVDEDPAWHAILGVDSAIDHTGEVCR